MADDLDSTPGASSASIYDASVAGLAVGAPEEASAPSVLAAQAVRDAVAALNAVAADAHAAGLHVEFSLDHRTDKWAYDARALKRPARIEVALSRPL